MVNHRLLYCLVFCFAAATSRAQVIPDSLRVDWSGAGAPNFFVDTANVADVKAFGAAGNGVTDDFNAIITALASLGGKSGVVYFPPGNYLVKSTLYLQDSVVYKGAGAGATTLTFDLGGVTGNCFNVQKNQTAPFFPVAGGFAYKSAQLILDSAGYFKAGDYAEIRQLNGPWDTNPAAWAQYAVGQVVRVAAVAGDTLTLQQPLRIAYDSALQVEIRRLIPRVNSGLECLRITRADSTAASVNYGVYFLYAARCRLRGVESERSVGAHVWAEVSTGLEITGCYFHDAYLYDGSSTHGYGVVLATHTGDSKIEDNVFRHLRHAMMVKQGANGNVFGYNYSIEPYRSEFPNDFGADISLHGHYPFANLFEGNIGQNLIVDQAYGPSGPHNTFFRNRVESYGIIISSGAVNSDGQNLVANEITGTGPLKGQYTLAGTGHFEYGNRDNGVIVPASTGPVGDTSYCHPGTPAFWAIPAPFPNIGPPFPVSGQTIPARERYLAGGVPTICAPVPVSVPEEIPYNSALVVEVTPAMATDVITLTVTHCRSDRIVVALYDLNGRAVYTGSGPTHGGRATFQFMVQNQRPGIYSVSVVDGYETRSKHVLIVRSE